jgi:glyoxylase-like metal-dependent hydrolase (beta-lactamase superfamily II)
MIAQPLVPGIYAISLGFVNAFLLDLGELTLIDTGIPGSEKKILRALAELGKPPAALRHILITHLHGDHTGGLPALQRASGAQTYMHPSEAADYAGGTTMRPVEAGPGLLNAVIKGRMPASRPLAAPAPIDNALHDGQVLEFAGGLQVIAAPGHTAGQVVFLSPQAGGVMFLGDACTHLLGRLGWSPIYEDLEEGRRTLRRLASIRFDTACFSHGPAITPGASDRLAAKFAA